MNIGNNTMHNKQISTQRIKVEHVFAFMKIFRILQRLNYYSTQKIEILFKAIANIYNLNLLHKN